MTKTRDVADGRGIIVTLVILGFALFIMTLSYSEFLTIAIISWLFLTLGIVITYQYYWGEYEGKSTPTKPRVPTKLSGFDRPSATIATSKRLSTFSPKYARRSAIE